VPPPSGPADSTADDLSTRYLLVILVEAITIAALYWFGRHFA
jgi:hypothetical protein